LPVPYSGDNGATLRHGRQVQEPSSAELLGHPPDARLLIVNADDLGMSPAINLAVVEAIEHGIARTCSLMPPGPAAADAVDLLRSRPAIPFGIHLTLVCESAQQPWGPVSPRSEVPSLLDPAGALSGPSGIPGLLARARIREVEQEFRAQVRAVLDTGLAPTHLDWHCLLDGGRDDVFDLTVALAQEHGLAVRAWSDRGRRRLRERGSPVTEHPFLDSFALDLDGKAARYADLLRSLPPGLTEWAVHPGSDADRSRGDHDRRVRSTDHAFLTSPQARRIVAEEGIVLTDHRAVQHAWSRR
jgi:predicted glycoside hydrolase/deacetylase ChbG (UPF0249 family)